MPYTTPRRVPPQGYRKAIHQRSPVEGVLGAGEISVDNGLQLNKEAYDRPVPSALIIVLLDVKTM